MSWLAIDQGTTSTRAILVDAAGTARRLGSWTHARSHPSPGRVEHDPRELLAHVARGIEAGRAAGARGWALANQGESCLAWDAATGEPVSPVIVWQDARTAADCARLEREGAAPLVAERAGLPLDPYFSAAKLGWILREIPRAAELAARGRLRMGTTDAFFRDRLTGRFETDLATASRTSLMHLATGRWDPDLCSLFGVPIGALPAITPVSGDLGAAAGLPLGAAIADQQAALYGHGCRSPGAAKITFGTGAFALALAGDRPPAAGTGPLPTVAWAEAGAAPVYALEGGVYAAAAALDWARGLGLFDDFAALEAAPPGSRLERGLAFVPALAGLACPHWDRGARGAWLGLTLETGAADMMQALLEGIAYRTAEVLARMPVTGPVAIDGGLSRSPRFCRLLADILRRPVRVAEEAERTALGLAMLAAETAGAHVALPAGGQMIEPDPDWPDLEDRFARARALAQARWM
ncbi:FGGY family carbohydrate kinase [Mangrovicoccus algicola]|uniref:ATP:glycerol 3-phosphotransferase n=1 Tax=Mangrovicoccus algicola TaxID=2771008 RepID=A0A8J7CYQ3_9RHOB|nr:FGGY family carbohydrate kinase [Mangrovicoccus algicola]MBE3639852.1 glycerol kinase [Mangrovicoccus algicola]